MSANDQGRFVAEDVDPPVWKQTVRARVIEHVFSPVIKSEPAGIAG